MNRELIQNLKQLKTCLVNKEMSGDDWEEKQEMIQKIKELTTYLNDASSRGIEFLKIKNNKKGAVG